ncbi:uncharacterized protein LOC121346698 [Onychostruthus taczanowskii]|uniref:uncharacterized protein LOC121346698 n=1 Tax=Onychostruthus taczanowskii TaxID=356909 RepID=UPI001B8099E5|nr:uncharacterized protein LOC121346698 [Onychostruthus taczanowskii]
MAGGAELLRAQRGVWGVPSPLSLPTPALPRPPAAEQMAAGWKSGREPGIGSAGRSRQRDAGNKPGRVRGPRPLPRVPRGPGATPAGVSGFAQHRVGKEKQGESRGSCWERGGLDAGTGKAGSAFAPARASVSLRPREGALGVGDARRGGTRSHIHGTGTGGWRRGSPPPFRPGLCRGSRGSAGLPTCHRPPRVPTATHAALSRACPRHSAPTATHGHVSPHLRRPPAPQSRCHPPRQSPWARQKVTALGTRCHLAAPSPCPAVAQEFRTGIVPAGSCHRVPSASCPLRALSARRVPLPSEHPSAMPWARRPNATGVWRLLRCHRAGEALTWPCRGDAGGRGGAGGAAGQDREPRRG